MHDDASVLDPSNAEQQAVLQLIENTSESLFLTGKAGTGKSTLLRYIDKHTHKRHVVLASTGIAALNVGGQTIHSFFKLPFRPLPPDDPDLSTIRNRIYEVFRYTKEHKALIKSLELIIIDEVSMVRADIIDAIDKLLRVYTGHPTIPFGGIQMLFVGDLYQLEPVVKTDERQILDRFYRSHFFFGARVFSHNPPVGIELRKVYRQSDECFVNILDRVRVGSVRHEDIRILNERVERDFQPIAEGLIITLGTKRAQVTAINEERLKALDTRLVTLEGRIDGEFSESTLPTDLNLSLKPKAQVMMLCNDKEKRWVNGTIGIVEDIDEEEGRVYVRLDDGIVHGIEQYVWENHRYTHNEEKQSIETETIGMFVQYPLRLAWAITIHKSQGLTFDRVIVDFTDRAFAGGQAYVALSRCRSLAGMILRTSVHMRDIIARQEVTSFYSRMNNPQIILQALERAEALRGYIIAAQAWNRGKYPEAIEALHSAISGSNELSNPIYLRMLSQKLYDIERLHQENLSLRAEIEAGRSELYQLSDEHTEMGREIMSITEDAESALRCYAKALRYNPHNISALIAQGRAYQTLRKREEALASLSKAVELSPRHPEALLALGEALLHYRQPEAALQPLLTRFAQDQQDTESLRLIIQAYKRLGDEDREEAFRQLLRQLKQKPNP